jgi:uncharacterized protein (DUF302 family)/rhodanese-related sulfurtransferase
MNEICFKKEIVASVESTIDQITQALKSEGFGVLTRIDLHSKIKEKLAKEIPAVVILGACNPQLAYEAYLENSDVASLLPCNAVVRDVGDGRVSVELAKPSSLMKMLGDTPLATLALDADLRLERALQTLGSNEIPEWSVAELRERLGRCEMIDVREPDEFVGPLSHIEGAKLVTLGPDLDRFFESRSEQEKSAQMVLICRSGVRSLRAAKQAQLLGFTRVINLKGGMIAWNDSNFPTHATQKGARS